MSTATIAAPRRRWVHRGGARNDPSAVAELARALRLPEPLCRLLVVRGYAGEDDAKAFLKPRLHQLGDPFELAGMDVAVERLERAIRDGETILVHGDYDVDGISSTALYTRVLQALGARVEPFVPNRMSDGYDLGPAGIRAAREAGASLILTADCGIVAHDAVEAAADAGIDVVVTDHHTPGPTLPPAVAVVNPNRPDCSYPNKGLAGAGVAFKVCQALASRREWDEEALLYHLDLVALATIADLVPLTGENRVLARYGLRVLARTRKPGLRALIDAAGLDGQDALRAGHVSFVLAPRINAVGRIGEALWGVRLLLTESEAEARSIAERLEEQNRTRKAVDRRILKEALEKLERGYDPARDYGVVLAGAGWHPGVIGIVASRVVERIHRPTVLIALDEDGGPSRGSARSIPAFHLYEALRECSEHLDRFGGHRQAAGLDIRAERVDAFREAFNARARAVLDEDDLVAEVAVDLDVALDAITERFFAILQHFGPFGTGNPSPVFAARNVGLAGAPWVVGNGHLKLELMQNGARLGAIGFGMADRLDALDPERGRVDVAFQLQENHWNGRTELQARLVDIRTAAS